MNGLLLAQRVLPKPGIPILEYHRVSPKIGPHDVHSIYPNEFEWQMRWLKEHGYRVITLRDVLDRIERGDVRDKFVAITFDDGHRDIARYAAPILKRYCARATVFVVTDYLGKNGWLTVDGGFSESGPGVQRWELLTWQELRGWADVFDVGVHGRTHRPLTALGDAEIQDEFDTARRAIVEQTGLSTDLYCYPYGKYDERTEALVQNSGFRCACTTRPGLNAGITDRFRLCRNEVGRGLLSADFALLMTHYARTYRSLGGWVRRI